jgi:iron complex transport system permease protein
MSTAAVQAAQATRTLESRRHRYWYGAFCCAVFLLVVLELTIGSVRIPLSGILQFLTSGHSGQDSWDRILGVARMPRLLNASCAGAALGVCGILLQTLFRNPLADPYILGTVHGARLGVAILLALTSTVGPVLGSQAALWGLIAMPAAAALGSGVATVVLMIAARRLERAALLIFGLMLGISSLGLVDRTLQFAGDSQAAVFRFWDHGSFNGATWPQLSIMLPAVAIGSILALTQVKALNALVLGENYASSMGIAVLRTRILSFSAAALLAGTVTAYCGPVAFLGLVVAQLTRAILRTADHKRLLPGAFLLGGALALAADFIAHLPWEGEPPHLDMLLGLLGAPVVMWFLLRRDNRYALTV